MGAPATLGIPKDHTAGNNPTADDSLGFAL
jgi:hypothetical protein